MARLCEKRRRGALFPVFNREEGRVGSTANLYAAGNLALDSSSLFTAEWNSAIATNGCLPFSWKLPVCLSSSFCQCQWLSIGLMSLLLAIKEKLGYQNTHTHFTWVHFIGGGKSKVNCRQQFGEVSIVTNRERLSFSLSLSPRAALSIRVLLLPEERPYVLVDTVPLTNRRT